MDLQTNTLVNGQWVNQTVRIQDILKASTVPKSNTTLPRAEPPACGILSRTVVESPVVHHILPVRIRSSAHNDVAFVGDRFVQISEIQPDGQLREIIRKTDFEFRIRNAVVLGSSPHDGTDDDAGIFIKAEDSPLMEDMENGDGTHIRPLPPQLLVLMLESGDAVFLFLRQRLGKLQFVMSGHENPSNIKYLGYHLAVDRTSRYMVAASASDAFMVFELQSMEVMNSQYLSDGTFEPVMSVHTRSMHGVLHKLEFLHPRPEDDYHVILLLVVVRHAISRVTTYEWEIGDKIKAVFDEDKPGNRLPDEHRMPLLIIPLRFKTAFFAVSQHSIGIVKYTLSGSPTVDLLHTDTPGKTKLHHGTIEPLWTAWARPFRRRAYLEKTDIIYVAREDGVIIHIEIDCKDLMASVTNVGSLNTNITTAFTTAYDRFSDMLIIGGDSGPGGVWKLPARSDLIQVATIPNWSPVIDLVTTDENSSWDTQPISSGPNSKKGTTSQSLRKPDRIFCTSGRGPKSSLTEFRWGYHARIGIDIEYHQPIRQSWMFPKGGLREKGFYALLSLPHSSDVLYIPPDLAGVEALAPEAVAFDIGSRTIYAFQNAFGTIVQITETAITLIAPLQSARHSYDDTFGVSNMVAEHAFTLDGFVVVSTHEGDTSRIHILKIDQMNISHFRSWDSRGEVTCLCLFESRGSLAVVVGSTVNGLQWVSLYTTEGREDMSMSVDTSEDTAAAQSQSGVDALTSVISIDNGNDHATLVFGTRSGHVVTARCTEGPNGRDEIVLHVERLGISPTNVFAASCPFDGDDAVFACCDNNLIVMTDFSPPPRKKRYIWATDSNDSSMPSPSVHSAYCLEKSLSGSRDHLSLMLLEGSRILLVDVWPHVGTVPRSIPLDGTPMRVIYSQTWKCLVVAHLKHDCPTLSFVDVDSGAIISSPTDRDGSQSEYISGLGSEGDRVFGLYEWRYVKDGKTFPFIIVTTLQGRLMIVSVTEQQSENDNGATRHLNYWTRYKKKGFVQPIRAVVGNSEGLVFCAGSSLHWEVLDLGEKKLKRVKQYELDSPATSLRITNGKVCVLTAAHSLQVIDLHVESESTHMSLIYSDKAARYTTHLIEMGDSSPRPHPESPLRNWPITLLSTVRGDIAGVWIPWGEQRHEFEVLFEGTLRTPVRRFRRGRTRPLWLLAQDRTRFQGLHSTTDGAEIFGVSLDGSLLHFSLIGAEAWRFLRLIQNLARRSLALCPMTHQMNLEDGANLEPRATTEQLHVDGDLLKRCFDYNQLEKVIDDADSWELYYEYLDQLLDTVLDTKLLEQVNKVKNSSGDARRSGYLQLGYQVLDQCLEQVF
ncbi:hypothetical protein G7046_g3376 [Stylonectria norvegica]|nr:hypothetical protein G7046_g3376 [Stylonectria norvegica]